jgi:hypothetical protein
MFQIGIYWSAVNLQRRIMEDETIETWSKSMAILAVDALLDSGHVTKSGFDVAVDVVATEIYIHLLINDYPPPREAETESAG